MGATHWSMAGDTTTDIHDPRCSRAYVRTIDDGTGALPETVTLVGVVHDHPASAYRARRIAADAEPAVLALELPPLAVPLFERYAAGESRRTPADGRGAGAPDVPGGEMTAAIAATDPDRIAGIDGPTVGYAARLFGQLRRADADLARGRAAAGELLRAWGHAARCRLAATYAGITGREPDLSDPRSHGIGPDAPPGAQAEDEHQQVRRARSIAAAFGGERGAARDAAREAHMAARIRSLAATGDVVAVLGVDHLDSVAARLGGDEES